MTLFERFPEALSRFPAHTELSMFVQVHQNWWATSVQRASSGCQGAEDGNVSPLVCDATRIPRYIPTFRSNTLYPCSGLKCSATFTLGCCDTCITPRFPQPEFYQHFIMTVNYAFIASTCRYTRVMELLGPAWGCVLGTAERCCLLFLIGISFNWHWSSSAVTLRARPCPFVQWQLTWCDMKNTFGMSVYSKEYSLLTSCFRNLTVTEFPFKAPCYSLPYSVARIQQKKNTTM